MAGFLGMRGTGDWADADSRPKSFREGLLMAYPNGMMPVTAINSKGKSKRVDDAEFKWWGKELPMMGGAATGVYKDQGLSSAYTTETGAINTPVYVKCSADTAAHFRPGHTVLGVDSDAPTNYAFGKVVALEKNGANSWVKFELKEATAANIIGAIDYLDVVGTAQPEGAGMPDALSYEAMKYVNYTQIFETTLDITRTQQQTRMRPVDAYKEAKRETHEQHGIALENSALFGVKSEMIGENGKMERTTWGMIPMLKDATYGCPDNVIHMPTLASTSWKTYGEDAFDECLELLFRNGRTSKLGVCGSGALLGIQKIAKENAHFSFTAQTASYGIKVVEWVTPFGVVYLKTHPLFTQKAYRRNSIFLYEPENLSFNYLNDTTFLSDNSQTNGGRGKVDGKKESYLTEGGWEYHFPKTMMLLTGVGLDGTAPEE